MNYPSCPDTGAAFLLAPAALFQLELPLHWSLVSLLWKNDGAQFLQLLLW
jgi:hypothetical protein